MRWLMASVMSLVVGLALVSPGATSPAGAVPAQGSTAGQIADEVAVTGNYVELSTPSGYEAALGRLNDGGTAFVWLDSEDDAQVVADAVLDELVSLSTPYRTVLALTDIGVAAASETVSTGRLDDALDESFIDFGNGDIVGGLDAFSESLNGAPATTSTTTGPVTADIAEDSSGSIGFGSIVIGALVLGGGFLLFRRFTNGRKEKAAAEADMEADRAEIKEQLRDNADHVLSLGDRVIASGNSELIALYEEASAAYQDVSQSVDGATTAEEIDELDDRIDNAEWQFDVIEARLEGRAVPPSPAEVEAQAEQQRRAAEAAERSDEPALGADESVFGPGSRSGGTATRRAPRPRRSTRRGGGLGGGLGSVLGSVILGGGLGGNRSRRSTRRGSTFPTSTRRSGSGSRTGGGLGGGVLRRGGSSSRRSSSSSRRRRSSSGRSFGSGGRSRSRSRGRSSRRF
ncbi:MAG: hypothetical protein AAGD35_17215 [Actinomycetota bacterium]